MGPRTSGAPVPLWRHLPSVSMHPCVMPWLLPARALEVHSLSGPGIPPPSQLAPWGLLGGSPRRQLDCTEVSCMEESTRAGCVITG